MKYGLNHESRSKLWNLIKIVTILVKWDLGSDDERTIQDCEIVWHELMIVESASSSFPPHVRHHPGWGSPALGLITHLTFSPSPPPPRNKLDHFHWLEKIGWSSFSYGRPSIEVSCLCGHFHTPFAPRPFYGWFFISWLYSEFIPSDSDSEYLIYYLESDKTFL